MLKSILALIGLTLALPLYPQATGSTLRFFAQDHEEGEVLDPDEWTEAFTHVFAEGRVRPPEGAGAMGTSSFPAKLGKVEARLLIDSRISKQVSIFMGWNPPAGSGHDAEEDLRVRFDTTDGESHVVQLYAGGGMALQFVSPFAVDPKLLESFTLLHKKKVKWRRGK